MAALYFQYLGGRDGGSPGDGNDSAGGRGTLRGQVKSAQGLPLARAQVQILREVGKTLTETTDENGRFSTDGLLAGSYRVSAWAEGYDYAEYGQSFSGGPAASMAVRNHEISTADFDLQPSARILGRVVDHRRRPLPGALVVAMREAFVAGRRELRSVVTNPREVRTSADGLFELAGLEAGDFFVSVTVGGAFFDEGASKRRMAYAPTFVPDVTDSQAATPVRASAAGTNVELRLTPLPLIRLRGKVVDSSGNPPSRGFVHLARPEALAPSVKTIPTRSDGTFDLQAIALEGAYTLTATSGTGTGQSNAEAGTTNVTIASKDIDGLLLRTSAGYSVHGVIVSDDHTTVAGLRVRALPINPRFGWPGVVSEPADERGRFHVEGIVAPAVLVVDKESVLTTRVLAKDIDITTRGMRLDMATTSTTVSITRHPAKLTGRLLGSDPAAARNLVAIAFATNPEKWCDPLGRYVQVAAILRDFSYSFTSLPPGEYFVALGLGIGPLTAGDPARLSKLSGNALRIQLSAGQTITRDLERHGGVK